MSLTRSYVDGFLVAWDEGEYEAQVKMLAARSKPARLLSGKPGPVGRVGAGEGSATETARKAQVVRERLARTVRRVPEVMVKITSSCKGMKQIGTHIDYISRKGEIALEDQDGFQVLGKDELKKLKDDWRLCGPRVIEDENEYRDTFNIVFSMPASTDEVSLKRAVRAFAKSEFKDHDYVMAYHTQSTDPDPDPPAHPHIHLSVKAERGDRKRLNPRKADLQRWRVGFASELRSHGVDANATTRLARLKRERGAKRSTQALVSKGEDLHSVGFLGASAGRVVWAKDLEQTRLGYYYAVAHTLGQSEDPNDKRLAMDLAQHMAEIVREVRSKSAEVQPKGPNVTPKRDLER